MISAGAEADGLQKPHVLPATNASAFAVFSRALEYLQAKGGAQHILSNLLRACVLVSSRSPWYFLCARSAVPATSAGELFVSMASSPEVQRAQRAFGSEFYDPMVPAPPLDPAAVSVLVIRSLHAMQPPLLAADECAAIAAEFLRDGTAHVRISVAMHTLDKLPAPRRDALQQLLRYLCRLAAFSEACSAAGLAQTIGPVLLRPEQLDVGRPAHELTAASIRATNMLIE